MAPNDPMPSVGEGDVDGSELLRSRTRTAHRRSASSRTSQRRPRTSAPSSAATAVDGIAVDVADHHARPFGDEAAHGGETDSRRTTGHHGGLPCESSFCHCGEASRGSRKDLEVSSRRIRRRLPCVRLP